jgi:metal-sulfur cluster biosynthetic enzyme
MAATPEAAVEAVRSAINEVIDPCSVAANRPMGIVEMGLVEDIVIDDGDLTVSLRLTSPSCMMVGVLTQHIRETASQVQGVETVAVKFDRGLDWSPDLIQLEMVDARHRRLGLVVDAQPAGAGAGSTKMSRSRSPAPGSTR